MRWLPIIILCVVLTLWNGTIQACPGFIFIESFGPGIIPGKRKDLKAFAIESRNGKPAWRQIAVQIDPFTFEGKLKFFTDEKWREERLHAYDRLSMASESFSTRYQAAIGFPCETEHIFEIATSDRRYAYLAFCKTMERDTAFMAPVAHDPEKGEVRTPDFLYRYARENHLLFNHLALSYGGSKVYPLAVAGSSDQVIRADVKKFFSMQFTKNDIEAQIAHERRGPLGLVGSVNFFLSILFFHIDLRLSPEVSFFDKVVFMPMVMHLPVDARKWLNPGSGLYYTWAPAPDVTVDWSHSKLPKFDAGKVKAGPEELAALGKPFCYDHKCRFKLVGEIATRLFALDFNIERRLVEKGFLPLFFSDQQQVENDMGAKVATIQDGKRMGMYFETAGLSQGDHEWEFLIRFADNYGDLIKQCPAELSTVASYRRPK